MTNDAIKKNSINFNYSYLVIAKNKVHWIQTSSSSNWFPTAEQLEKKIKSNKSL